VSQTNQLIERGLQAWMVGDLDALEAILDPDVRLRAVEPGPWDCTGRDEVIALLRQRQAQRGEQKPSATHVRQLDNQTFVVETNTPIDPDGPQPFPVATRITLDHGKVVDMQQYRVDPTD
jgi:ketosteroid isomerase-like protein